MSTTPRNAIKDAALRLTNDDNAFRGYDNAENVIADIIADETAKLQRDLADARAELSEAKDLIAEIRKNCDHEWEFLDQSFDHEHGCEQVHSWHCEKCGESTNRDPRPEHDDP